MVEENSQNLKIPDKAKLTDKCQKSFLHFLNLNISYKNTITGDEKWVFLDNVQCKDESPQPSAKGRAS